MNRTIKQIVYGLFYLIILGIIIAGVYFIFIREPATCFDGQQNQNEEGKDCGGSCVSCALKNAKDLTVLPVEIFNNNGKSTILFKIINPNPTIGIENLPYVIKPLFINGETFIYPGENKFIIEAAIDIDPLLATKGKLILDYSSKSWREDFIKPTVELADVKKQLVDNRVIITGQIVNNNAFALEKTSVVGILRNKLHLKVGASKSVVGRVEAFNKKNFKIVIPLKKDITRDFDLNNVQVIAEAKQ